MYPNPFNYERPYTGQTAFDDRCPICGATGDCPDAAAVAMPYPPFDLDTEAEPAAATPLRSYTVTLFGFTTVMRLDDSDAARYGDAAVLIP